MKKITLLIMAGILLLLASGASAAALLSPQLQTKHYEDPPNPCYEKCTPWMQQLEHEFNTDSDLLYLEPALFSGECRHLSDSYNPDHVHYSVVMIDKKSSGEYYFSTQFVFFAEHNEYADWNLARARTEMSDYWKDNGKIIRGYLSSRIEINYDDGNPAYIYWIRQNPRTGELYYITYAGIHMKSFCRLQKHVE